MKAEKEAIIKASATMIGTIIGVGMFGVPYAMSRAGFFVGLFYFIFLGIVILVLHYFYTDVVLNTRQKHRYIGYAKKYLGPKGKRIAYLTTILGIGGSLIAYIIVGGEFLYALVGSYFGGDVFDYQVVFFVALSFMVLIGLRLISTIEIGMTLFLLIVMATIFIYGIPRVEASNLFTIDHRNLFLPYGVILLAIGGMNAIPEIRDVLSRYGRDMRRVVTWSTIIPITLIGIFSFVVVGITGPNTSEEAILGLSAVWGDWMIYVGALFGFLAILTSALVIMTNLKESFMYDFKFDKYLAWFIVSFLPFLVFLAGAQDFINVIGFTGAVFGGANGILMTLMYLKLRKTKKPLHPILQWPVFIPYLVIVVFSLGILYEIAYTLLK